MLTFKKHTIPDLEFKKAIKKPIAIHCIQIDEPFKVETMEGTMKGKKELLADILFSSNLVNLFKRLPMRNKLLILNYHRIRPNDPHFTTAFDDGVYGVDSDEFARQIKWLKNNTQIMSGEKSYVYDLD